MAKSLIVSAMLASIGLAVPLLAQAREPSASRPPKVYIDNGACPFECCAYRDWTVDADTQLYDLPGGKRLAIALKKGERVTGVTGEVHVTPQRVRVRRDQPPFRRGEIFYLLTYLGEGAFRAWYKGEVIQVAPGFAREGPDSCSRSRKGCWAEPESRYRSKWWVKVRSESGAEGWSDQPENFGNKDACG